MPSSWSGSWSTAYPRPQLVPGEWQNLCGTWQFAYDDSDVGLGDGWSATSEPFDRRIEVPYPPESQRSGLGDPGFHPVAWYRRQVHLAPVGPGRRVLLHLGAVDYRATVWVNGHQVAEHEGGHTPFSADITTALREGGDQVVVVRAEDPIDDVEQPRGKQDWHREPHAIWYHRTTGIWQPVWLETVGEQHVTGLVWTPDVDAGRIALDVTLSRVPVEGTRFEVRLTLDGDVLAEQTTRVTGSHGVCVLDLPAARNGEERHRLWWSPEHPHLIDARIRVVGADGDVLDEVTSYVGFRSVGVAKGRFLLNGLPYFLRLALEQGYWPESHLAAPDDEALRAEVEAAKALGFNGIRIHQKIEDPRFLAWCDRLGLLVWEEMPSAYAFGDRAVRRVVQEWTEAVRRDRSHPSVVTWVPLNESWGVPEIRTDQAQQHHALALYHLTKALDPSRPVIANDGWELARGDLLGVHDYTASGDTLRSRYQDADAVERVLTGGGPGRHPVLLEGDVWRGQPLVVSEFGGLSLRPQEGERWFGYATLTSDEEYLQRFSELVDALLDSPEIAGFCYTQLTDTEQEKNGLLAADRTPKLPVARIHEVLTRPSRAVPAEEVDAARAAARPAAGTEGVTHG